MTSSNTVAGNAAAGTGVGPRDLHAVVGIAKAYATRAKLGPFPTQRMTSKKRHCPKGGEFGRPPGGPARVAGLMRPWRHAVRLNGATHLALTKLDVLSGLDTLKIAVSHNTPDGGDASRVVLSTRMRWMVRGHHGMPYMGRTAPDLSRLCRAY